MNSISPDQNLGRRQVLEALRDRLSLELDGAAPEALPALSRELRLVVKELDSLPAVSGPVRLEDALAARRKAKQAADG